MTRAWPTADPAAAAADGDAEPALELTILMPCLNEALTVQVCIAKAQAYLHKRGIMGEVLVADNGSTDGSRTLAAAAGARIVEVADKGYGAALLGGIEAARGRFVIMGDADDSYDFTNLDDFLNHLRQGFALVMGNRFQGGIRPGAMPLLNRYLGNPALSFIGRTLFASPVGDFHCGMRGFDRRAILDLNLRAAGMEFASEMVVKASLARLRIAEVPTTLSPDGRRRAPHLRPWRDGWRHLRYMLLRSPQWLFLYPGLTLGAAGLLGTAVLMRAPLRVPGLFTLDINSLLYFAIASLLGVQITFFGLFALAIARRMQMSIAQGLPQTLLRWASLDIAIVVGACLASAGLGGAAYAIVQWGHTSFGPLVPSEMMRITIPAVMSIAVGTQIIFGGFLLGFIEID